MVAVLGILYLVFCVYLTIDMVSLSGVYIIFFHVDKIDGGDRDGDKVYRTLE